MKRLGSIMQNRELKLRTKKPPAPTTRKSPGRFAFRPQETTAKQTREGARTQTTPTQEQPDLPLTQGEVPPCHQKLTKTCTLKLYCYCQRPSKRCENQCNCQLIFLTGALCLSAGRGVLRLTRLPRHDRGPVPGGNRSAASCLCTVLRRALSTTRRDRLVQLPLKKWQIRIFYWRPIHHGSLLRFLSHVLFQSSVVRLRSSRS